MPHCGEACTENRTFLRRVARHLVKEHGISQFLDIGSGLPTASNVHEAAQEAGPGSRVVYADNDHIVAAHARALLANSGDGVLAVECDVRGPSRGAQDRAVAWCRSWRQAAALPNAAGKRFLAASGLSRSAGHGAGPGKTGQRGQARQALPSRTSRWRRALPAGGS